MVIHRVVRWSTIRDCKRCVGRQMKISSKWYTCAPYQLRKKGALWHDITSIIHNGNEATATTANQNLLWCHVEWVELQCSWLAFQNERGTWEGETAQRTERCWSCEWSMKMTLSRTLINAYCFALLNYNVTLMYY